VRSKLINIYHETTVLLDPAGSHLKTGIKKSNYIGEWRNSRASLSAAGRLNTALLTHCTQSCISTTASVHVTVGHFRRRLQHVIVTIIQTVAGVDTGLRRQHKHSGTSAIVPIWVELTLKSLPNVRLSTRQRRKTKPRLPDIILGFTVAVEGLQLLFVRLTELACCICREPCLAFITYHDWGSEVSDTDTKERHSHISFACWTQSATDISVYC